MKQKNEETGKWRATNNGTVDNLIVIDYNQNKIMTYSQKKDWDLDILTPTPKKEVRNEWTIYTWSCNDDLNLECKAIYVIDPENKPLLFAIEYPTVRVDFIFNP